MALAILKSNEAEICAADSAGDLFTFVSGMTARLWAADKLILVSYPCIKFVLPVGMSRADQYRLSMGIELWYDIRTLLLDTLNI